MDRAGTLSESLISESFALAESENVLKAAPRQAPEKAKATTFVGQFVDACISFVASFRGPSERDVQRAKNQGAHDYVQQALGELYGTKLDNSNILSLSLSPYVKNQYQQYFKDDIKKGLAVSPDKVKAFAASLNTNDSIISEQIRQLSAMQEKSQTGTDSVKIQKPFNPIRGAIKRADRFAGAVVSFFSSKKPTVSALTDPNRTALPSSPAATDLLKIKEAAQLAKSPGGSSAIDSGKPGSTTSITKSNSTASSSTSSSSSKAAKSETTSSTTLSTSGQSTLQPLGDTLTTFSPNHGLSEQQMQELQQGKPVCKLTPHERQKEGARFLPTTTVYQLVNVDPKKCTPEQAAKLFADPHNAPTLMGKQCLEATTQNGLTHYKLTNPLGTYYLDAKVEATLSPEHPSGYQVTSSLQQSDLSERNEGRCTIAPVTVGNKSQLLIIRRLEATLLKDPKVGFMTVPAARVNASHEEASTSLVTNFKGLIEKQAAST